MTAAATGSRCGAVLVEALLGALLGALVLAGALDVIVRVTRASHEHEARAAARAQLEQAATALATDLRAVTTTAAAADDPADLRAVSDTSVELDATIGGGVACATAATPDAGSTLDLAGIPDTPSAPTLAWWNVPPRAGDLVYLHDAGNTPTPTDDRWTVRAVRAVSEATTYCRSGPFAAAAAAAARPDGVRLRLTLEPPQLAGSIGAGTPVRIARRRRYSLYRASDDWQLGMRDWDGNGWDTIQPVAGPFAPPADRGLLLDAVDGADVPVRGTPPSALVTEIRVLVRALCSARDPRLRCADSTVAVVRPRGNA